MKKYKLIENGYGVYKREKVYPEDYKDIDSPYSVKELISLYPQDWELVEDEFVLPEKWKVKPTNKQEDDILINWRGGGHIGKIGKSYMTSDRCWCAIDADYIDKFVEITFEQFKKYVLNMKEEKEIIEYKLKENCKKYENAVFKILNVNCFNSIHQGCDLSVEWSITKIKEAGVLDLWFEPVYKQEEPEYKIGDWVIGWHCYIEEGYHCKAWQIYDIDKEYLCPKKDYATNKFNVKKATEEEIKAAQTPQITINGYKGEFFNDYVKFGCAIINKQCFIDLYSFADKSYRGQNRRVETITIGKGTFSKEQIKEIAKYFLNKDK